jgi:beta-glucosidase
MTTEMTGERSQLAALPLDDKARLATGADSWRTHGCAALGLRPMVTSDGPSGVRGVTLDESNPSSCLPCASALGASWDPALVRELAAALGAEARSKGVDILLAPQVNLMRTPLGGRGFECFSEDSELTARLAVSYVQGVQSAGVMAAVKHFVGNDSETQRWSYDARICEQVLRELYLIPFEAVVREAAAGVIMAAYNSVNGSRMTEHSRLLRDVLKREWGFDGLVVSDWDAARSTVPAAVGGLDLAMPGPNAFWGQTLADAVRSGAVPQDMMDDKVVRLLRTARRVGAVSNGSPATTADGSPPVLVGADLLRRAVAASVVLLHNGGSVLPLDPGETRSIAVIGPNAADPVIQGGGSARVIPAVLPSPAGSLREALGDDVAITTALGCQTWTTVPEPPAGCVTDPETGEPGVRLEFLAGGGGSHPSEDAPLIQPGEHRAATALAWWDGLPPGVGWGESGVIRLRTCFRASHTGRYVFGVAGVGHLTITVDGAVVAQAQTPVPTDPVETMTRPGEIRAEVELTGGQETPVSIDFLPAAACQGPVALRLGITAWADADALMSEAVAAASQAGVAVVVVGSSQSSESEGYDRDTLVLPGRQDELVERVAAVNPRTVVVVNAGMPVLLPWTGRVAAVLYAWLPGQAMGEALADVLLGHAEPGGRLPVTLPAAEADCPVLHTIPCDGRLEYAEGLLMGYRGYDAAGTAPRFPFGHGLGYTSWDYEKLDAAAGLAAGDDLTVRVRVRNSGSRRGREVVQAYVSGPGAGQGRPVRVLGAFAGAAAEPGEAVEVTLRVPARVFAEFDEAAGVWAWPPGEFTIAVGRSSRDLRLTATVRLG